jgi:hypothetical protein
MLIGPRRVLVTASRDLKSHEPLWSTLDNHMSLALAEERQLIIVQGGASGGDEIARNWGHAMRRAGLDVVVETHPAKNHPTEDFGDWPECGPRRNRFMVGLGATECVAMIGPCTSSRCRRTYPHGSHGASGCADMATAAGIPVDRWDLWKES